MVNSKNDEYSRLNGQEVCCYDEGEVNRVLPEWVWGLACIGGALLYLLVNQISRARYDKLISNMGIEPKTARWLPASLLWLEKAQPALDTHPSLASLRQAVMQIYGPAHSHTMYRAVMAEMALYAYAALLAALLLPAVTDGSFANMAGGLLLGTILPLARARDVINRAESKRQELQLELPELLSKLTLLVQAGETVQKALALCIERKREERYGHPLYAELNRMMKDIQNGYSFPQAMEQFAKRCAMQEVSMFVTTLLMNHRRGGATFVLAMEELGRQLWEKRKSVARKRGEEVSTKLVFPMMLMFLVVLAVVGAPALLMMK